MADTRKIQLQTTVDNTQARAGFNELKRDGKAAMGELKTAAGQTSKAIDGIGDVAASVGSKFSREESRIAASIARSTQALREAGKLASERFETRIEARGLDAGKFAPALEQLRALEAQQRGVGVSAAQMQAALRGVPAQFTDIATALASGQQPLTVFLQQGGQLKDMFGGAGPAARALGGYIADLVNPYTVAAAAAGALAVAYFKGASEAEEFTKQIILTGNAAGVTRDQLAGMAQGVRQVVGTQGRAADVLAQLVSTGRVSRDVLQGATTAIVTMADSAGIKTEQLVKDMAELGRSPVDGIKKLNEQYSFLSASTFQQIKALEDQGRADQAAALAQKTYSDMLQQRGEEVKKSLGLLERSWNSVSGAAKRAWDSMLDVGRERTSDEKLDELRRRLDEELSGKRIVNDYGGPNRQQRIAQLRQEIGQLLTQKLQAEAGAARQAAQRQIENAGIAATDEIERQRQSLATAGQKMADELKRYRDNLGKVRAAATAADLANKDSRASQLLDPAKVAADEAAIRAKYADKDAARAAKKAADDARRDVEAFQRLLNESVGKTADVLPTYADDLKAIYSGWKLSGQGVEAYQRAIEAYAAKQPAVLDAAKAQVEFEREVNRARKAAAEEAGRAYEALVRQDQQSAVSAADRLRAAQDEQAALAIAAAGNITLAQAVEQVSIARLQERRDQASARGEYERVGEIEAEIQARKQLLGLLGQKAADDKAADAFKSLMSGDIGTNFSAGFDKASASLGTFVETFGKLVDRQEQYALAKQKAGATDKELAALDARYTRMQLNSYASLAGAARGFFAEKTAGYKALTLAEQTLRAVELASSLGRIASKGAEAAAGAVAGVINQASGDPYTAFGRMAAMAAIMASLGYAVGGSFGSSGSFAATNTGTGTVLGDPSAKSESIARSIDALADIDTATMRYSAQMLASLQSIESNIGGLATLLIRSGGLDAAAAGVQTGFKRDGIGNAIASGYDITSAVLRSIPVVGGLMGGLNAAIGNLVSGLFGTKTSIKGQGIAGGPQSLDDILAGGFEALYYTDVESKKKFLGATTSTKRKSIYTDADALLEQQITTVFRSFNDAVVAAAGPLGLSLDTVQQRLSSFVVDIGRIDLKGLSGEQAQQRLTDVFSAQGDRLAAAVLAGYEQFQRVGEGYFETAVRVASGLEQARTVLRRLGVTAVEVAAIQRKQADVSAELVRQSLLAAEGQGRLSDVLRVASGSADEIAQMYRSLTDVRMSLRLLGLDASAVGFDLIDGAGGLQELVDAVSAFESGFLSGSDQVTLKAARVAEQFRVLGLAMPTSNDAFVQLVRGIDTSSESGRLLLGSVLGLSSAFGDLMGAIEDVGSGIADEIERIKGLSAAGNSSAGYTELQARFAVQTAMARAGDQSAIDALPSISQALLKAAEASASSSTDLAVIQARTLASLQETLAAVTNPAGRLGASVATSAVSPLVSALSAPGGGVASVGTLPGSGVSSSVAAAAAADNAALVAEVKALRTEVASLRAEQAAQASAMLISTNRAAFVLEAVNQDGQALAVKTT